MRNEPLEMLLMRLRRRRRSILWNIMSISWEDLVGERWLTSISDIIIRNVFIQCTSESIEATILLRLSVIHIVLNLLMLRKNTKLSILIELKKKLSIRASIKSSKYCLKNLANLTSQFRLLLFLSKQQTRRNFKTGVLTKLFMKRVHNSLTTHYLLEETLTTIPLLSLTQQKN